jgi:hypothetical protein
MSLARNDPRPRRPQCLEPGLFPEEGARRARNLVHDGDVSGEHVRELRQKQRRTKIAHQLFVQQTSPVRCGPTLLQKLAVERGIALAARCHDEKISVREHARIPLDAGALERQSSSVGSDTLPGVHHSLVRLGDLLCKVHGSDGMDDVW